MEALECGAACLAMILAYHKSWVPLELLRRDCGVTRDGSKASNILKVARARHMIAKGFKKEPGALGHLSLPCIIHWNFNHYVVFEGFHKGRAYINDPAHGPRDITLQEFNDSYTGIVLTFEPDANFVREGSKPGFVKPLMRYLEGESSGLVYVVLVSLMLVLPGIAIAGMLQVFIDQVLIGTSKSWLYPLMFGLIVAAFLNAALTALQQKYLLRLETKLSLRMSASFVWHMLRLPMHFFTQRHVGDLSDRIATNDDVASMISGDLASNVINLVSVIFYGLVIAMYDVWIALIGFTLTLVNVLILRITSRRREDINRALLNDGAKWSASTLGTIRTIETLKASGIEHEAFSQWSGYQAKILGDSQKLGMMNVRLAVLPVLLESITGLAVLAIGGLNIMNGTMTIGALVAVRTLMGSFTGPISALAGMWDELVQIKASLTRLDDINAHPINWTLDNDNSGNAGPTGNQTKIRSHLVNLTGQIELKKVSFSYSPFDLPLVDEFSMVLEPGSRVALVGSSGSGKSTLGKLMCGLLEPVRGQVCLDDVAIENIPRQIFAGSVAYVDQDIFLFEGSVRDNLTLWDTSISDEAITRALKDAAIHDVIMARPGTYNCHVAEAGENFSGGQRQRLEIARALVNNPSLVILDEATSALDPATEKMIDDNLRRRGCACIIIAHRLSTIRDCEQIIVLHQGQIVERGDHHGLLAMDGHYAELIDSEG